MNDDLLLTRDQEVTSVLSQVDMLITQALEEVQLEGEMGPTRPEDDLILEVDPKRRGIGLTIPGVLPGYPIRKKPIG
jgi:hypothetical protein